MFPFLSSKKILSWLTDFILVQLFLTLISLPILVGWGLPLSLVAPFGNLFFGPVLGLYLVSALGVFFTELVGIPNAWCIRLLEAVSTVWIWLLDMLERSVHLGFACPSVFVLSSIPLGACGIVWCYRRQLHRMGIAVLSVFLILVCVFLHAIQNPITQFSVFHGAKSVSCTVANGCVAIIDGQGVFSSRVAIDEWVVYHLIPTITAHTAITDIDHIMIVHPRQRTFEALASLSSRVRIRCVYMPRWQGKISMSAWRAYCNMRTALEKNETKLIVCDGPRSIVLSESKALQYAPTSKHGRYHDSVYPLFSCC